MNIEKRSNNKYRIRVTICGIAYKINVDHKPTKSEAQILIANALATRQPEEKVDFRSTRKRRITLEKAIEQYFECKSNILSPTTLRGYNSLKKGITTELLETPINKLTEYQLQAFINEHSKTHAPKTTKNMYTFIKAVLSFYKAGDDIDCTLPRPIREKVYMPSLVDIKRIMEAVSGTEYEIPYRLALYGLRRGEILAITPSDLEGNYLTINKALVMDINNHYFINPHPKTDASNRTIEIDQELADMIKKQGYVFTLHPQRLYKHLQKLLEELQIPAFSFHRFRAFLQLTLTI